MSKEIYKYKCLCKQLTDIEIQQAELNYHVNLMIEEWKKFEKIVVPDGENFIHARIFMEDLAENCILNRKDHSFDNVIESSEDIKFLWRMINMQGLRLFSLSDRKLYKEFTSFFLKDIWFDPSESYIVDYWEKRGRKFE